MSSRQWFLHRLVSVLSRSQILFFFVEMHNALKILFRWSMWMHKFKHFNVVLVKVEIFWFSYFRKFLYFDADITRRMHITIVLVTLMLLLWRFIFNKVLIHEMFDVHFLEVHSFSILFLLWQSHSAESSPIN